MRLDVPNEIRNCPRIGSILCEPTIGRSAGARDSALFQNEIPRVLQILLDQTHHVCREAQAESGRASFRIFQQIGVRKLTPTVR